MSNSNTDRLTYVAKRILTILDSSRVAIFSIIGENIKGETFVARNSNPNRGAIVNENWQCFFQPISPLAAEAVSDETTTEIQPDHKSIQNFERTIADGKPMLCAPIIFKIRNEKKVIIGERIVGVIYIGGKLHEQDWTGQDKQKLELFADSISSVIGNPEN